MSCRIEYQTIEESVLQAEVSGRSTLANAAWIARDIAREAGKAMRKRVLIDVRNLSDRVGTLATLATADGNMRRVEGYRVAMVDSEEYDRYYAFAELKARQFGCRLRRFSDRAAAAAWLKYSHD